jgi:antitoxin (DNA-binding transcriptional repressor) of toxin-antitoxin stability system
MTIHGEEVVLNKAGVPVVTLVPKAEAVVIEREARAAKRAAAIGFAREKYAGYPPEAFDVPPSMTDEEYEERITRKFGAPPA